MVHLKSTFEYGARDKDDCVTRSKNCACQRLERAPRLFTCAGRDVRAGPTVEAVVASVGGKCQTTKSKSQKSAKFQFPKDDSNGGLRVAGSMLRATVSFKDMPNGRCLANPVRGCLFIAPPCHRFTFCFSAARAVGLRTFSTVGRAAEKQRGGVVRVGML